MVITVWVALAVLAASAWFLYRSRSNYLLLPEMAVVQATPSSLATYTNRLTVVIPARNEKDNIQRVVGSFAGLRVIVVDDDSTDATVVLARQAGAEVIAAPPLPTGHTGKPNACLAGARTAETDWVLFVDADTWYEPGFVPSLLHYAEHHNLEMLSCFLRQHRGSIAERVLLPYAFALYFCGVSARRVNQSGRAGEALANGQCLLVRRESYWGMGGHEAVRDSVIEDVALARHARQAGLRTRVVRAEHLGHVRMYDSLAAIWRGFQKNSFRFLAANRWSGVQVVAASILLTSYLPLIASLLVANQYAAAAVYAMGVPALLAPWYGAWREAVWAPAAIYLFQLIALSGMFSALTGRKTLWKGRGV
jgi:cellulose synthase/poly-beta-1,6-N-acetylglucosamine synthase-like glycosyltransferase